MTDTQNAGVQNAPQGTENLEPQTTGVGAPNSQSNAGRGATPPAGLQGIGVGEKKGGETAAERRFRLKVDGADVEMTEAEVLEHARLGKAAFKRMHEAAEVKKQAMQKLERLKDPQKLFEVLTDPELGLSEEQIRSAFEDWYEQKVIEPSKLTAEQRRIRELEARIAAAEAKEKQEIERQQSEQRSKLAQNYEEKFQAEIIGAIQQGGLPADPKTVSRIAYYMSENIRQKLGLPMSAIVDRVKLDYQTELKSLVGGFEPEKLVKFIGEDVAKGLAAHYATELRKRKGLVSAADVMGQPSEPAPTRRVPEERKNTPAFSKSWIPVVD